MHACYHFHNDLLQLLHPHWKTANPIVQPVTRAASIKDAIESFGLPHTEIGKITCDGRPIDFRHRVENGRHFEISPHQLPWNVMRPNMLYPIPLPELRFVVDITAGRLARYLRMAGFDTLYDADWNTSTILAVLQDEHRVLLSRSLELLKRKQVIFGRYIRSERPRDQLIEIFRLFGIRDLPHPLCRCLQCNTLLEPVEKREILPRLEPLTVRYVDLFSICRACDRIYWEGSHVEKMRRVLTQACIDHGENAGKP